MNPSLFLTLAVIGYVNLIRCFIHLKKYKSGNILSVKKISYGTYTTETKGSTVRCGKIQWKGLTVEIPLKTANSTIITTISTTKANVKKYKNKDFIDVFVSYYPDGRISSVYLKDDMVTVYELIFSLLIGVIFSVIAIAVIVIDGIA